MSGFEPLAFRVQGGRSTNWATSPTLSLSTLNINCSKTIPPKMVGLSRLERLTSPLSAECSNQLSYRPVYNKYLIFLIFWRPHEWDIKTDHDTPVFNQVKLVESISLERRWSSRRFSYSYLVTTSPQSLPIPSASASFNRLAKMISGTDSFRGVTGGVYKVRERIHRVVLIRDY